MQCSYRANDARCPDPATVDVTGEGVPEGTRIGLCSHHAKELLRPGRMPSWEAPPLKVGHTAARSRCEAWNRTYAVGTRVRYWFGARGTSRPLTRPTGEAKTADRARVVAGVPVVRLETGVAVSIDHVEALQ